MSNFTPESARSQPVIKALFFLWAGILAGSVSVELLRNNPLLNGGIAYYKAYNVNKEQFATQLKGHQPFSNPLFEVLAYIDIQLQNWAKLQYCKKDSSKLACRTILQQL